MRAIFLFILVVSLSIAVLPGLSSTRVGAVDFLQYWSSMQVLLEGGNPYDREVLLAMQSSVWDKGKMSLPITMYNPPLIFPFLLPLSFLSYSAGIFVWLVACCCTIIAGAWLLMGRVQPRRRLLLVCFLLTYTPIYTLLFYGQSSHLLFLGVAVFFWGAGRSLIGTNESVGGGYLGGLCLSLTMIKPHVCYLVYVVLLLESLRKKDFRALLGFTGAVVFLLAFAVCLQPSLLAWYLDFSRTPPIFWRTPTLGSWLQLYTGVHSTLVRFVPTLLVALGVGGYFCLRRPSTPLFYHLLWVIPLSALSSPYGWLYDQLITLPVLFCLLSHYMDKKRVYHVAFLFGCNGIALLLPASIGQEYYLWWPAITCMLVWWEMYQGEEPVLPWMTGRNLSNHFEQLIQPIPTSV